MSDAPEQSKPLSALALALAEIETLTNAGVIEVAIRNPNVSEYMTHWEERALKAEARVIAAEKLAEALKSCSKANWSEFRKTENFYKMLGAVDEIKDAALAEWEALK